MHTFNFMLSNSDSNKIGTNSQQKQQQKEFSLCIFAQWLPDEYLTSKLFSDLANSIYNYGIHGFARVLWLQRWEIKPFIMQQGFLHGVTALLATHLVWGLMLLRAISDGPHFDCPSQQASLTVLASEFQFLFLSIYKRVWTTQNKLSH